MIVNDIRLPFDHTNEQLVNKIKQKSGLKNIYRYDIKRKSLDARNKKNILYVYSVEVCAKKEDYIEKKILLDGTKEINAKTRPVIAGTGPAGLFCGLYLAKAGFRPILLERGKEVSKREKDVENFKSGRILDENSNIQFGEGGAGTFSDGKLNTGVSGTIAKEVLEVFARFGAGEEIAYTAKPHVGTDVLKNVVENIRKEIIALGGEFRFESCLRDFDATDGKVRKVCADTDIETDCLVLAVGHSARDTFELVESKGAFMEPKPFSVGVRIEHPQSLINKAQYGMEHKLLPAADYKLACHLPSGRGVYTFCMCPGGYVVGATSEKNQVVTNGMSYRARDGVNANSALLVSVTPDDFKSGVLSGIEFQREIEQKAFEVGGGNYDAPCQLLGDFMKNQTSESFGSVVPTCFPGVKKADLTKALPSFVCDGLKAALPQMAQKIRDFDLYDAVITAPETRSSSPVRILRDEDFESNIKGLYPAGEGAGYAGGITSSAADGIKIALKIIEKYKG